ncbi:hypothetical protein MYX64_00655 [Nitrospinae bacterium AH_259_B05_G02_I21]|nr:hypothetical protein [Nitrospinae bacterium AH_259_B05_G02_I21]MDA2931649.1 hypothetical protein [Nitrospinae bacterium AH-259-F20]
MGAEVKLARLPGSGACLVYAVLGLEEEPLAVLKVASRWRERRAYRVNILKRNFRYLEPAQRFAREHEILETLAPHDLSPKPLAATEHYFLQAYVEGPLVAELLRRQDPRGKYWWFEALKALRAIHAWGIAHGDARPTNAIVAEGGVKFFDFEHCLDTETVSWEQQQAFDVLRYFANTFHEGFVTDANFVDDAVEFVYQELPEVVRQELPTSMKSFGFEPTPFLCRLCDGASTGQADLLSDLRG